MSNIMSRAEFRRMMKEHNKMIDHFISKKLMIEFDRKLDKRKERCIAYTKLALSLLTDENNNPIDDGSLDAILEPRVINVADFTMFNLHDPDYIEQRISGFKKLHALIKENNLTFDDAARLILAENNEDLDDNDVKLYSFMIEKVICGIYDDNGNNPFETMEVDFNKAITSLRHAIAKRS